MCKMKVLSAVMEYTSLISVGIWWKQHQNIHFNIEIIFVLVKLHQKPYPLCFYIHPLRKLPVWSYLSFCLFKYLFSFSTLEVFIKLFSMQLHLNCMTWDNQDSSNEMRYISIMLLSFAFSLPLFFFIISWCFIWNK